MLFFHIRGGDIINVLYIVFVSEYNAPDDFEVIWEKELQKTHPNQKKKSTEKLFVLKSEGRKKINTV